MTLLFATTTAKAQQTDEERLQALEQGLEELRQSVARQEDVNARLDRFERELASLRQDMAAESASPDNLADEIITDPVDFSSVPAQDVPSGVQGAPNPLRDVSEYLTGDDLLDESFPNSFAIPGTPIRLKIGGYAKADFIHDLDYVGDRFEFELASIPTPNDPEYFYDGQTTFHAKETRLNFDFRSKAANPFTGTDMPLKAFMEIDFFDDREQFSLQPRLRHAYGVVGRVLVGRTWTTAGDLEALAGTIDFSGGDALYGDRLTQIRWQDRLNDATTWAVAIEEPKSSIGNPLAIDGRNRTTYPALAGKIRWQAEDGSHAQVGLDLFPLEWQGGEFGPSDKEWGYGVNLTGRLLVGKKGRDALVAGLSFGEAAAHRVVSLAFDGGNDAVITPNGLDLISHRQAYAGFSHYWTDSLNSTFTYNWSELDNVAGQPGDTIHSATAAHANIIWFPYPLVSTGFEVMWGEREDKDGSKGDAVRLQYMVKYKFN